MPKRPTVGPTGEFPLGGPIIPQDRGGLFAGVIINRSARLIITHFGTPVDWLTTTGDTANGMALMYRRIVADAFGPMKYDATTLPITVTANTEKRLVEIRLPTITDVLAANPEVYLAWADKLEEAANNLPPLN